MSLNILVQHQLHKTSLRSTDVRYVFTARRRDEIGSWPKSSRKITFSRDN